MFWLYRYKGFSRTAARTVHTAVVLAGQQGCSQADTGHLLLALVQTARGTAADFLRRKRVTATALAGCSAAHHTTGSGSSQTHQGFFLPGVVDYLSSPR